MISRFSIAVLSYSFKQEKEDYFFADGLTMETIHSLCSYEFMHVVSRHSSARFATSDHDIQDIRNKLRVNWLVEGRLQTSGEELSIITQLIDTNEGAVVKSFSHTGKSENLAGLGRQIASGIALHIESRAKPFPSKENTGSSSSEAIEEYMKGQYLLNQLDNSLWKEMLDHFKRSLDHDPEYARPMVALCHSYSWLSSIGIIDPVSARQEIDKLIKQLFALQYRISDVYQLLAEKLFWIEWKPVQALEQLNLALELNPSNSAALVMKGLVLASLGKIEEALDALFMSERLNPYGENVKYCIGLIYRYIGDFEKAYSYLLESLKMSPGWLAPYFTLVEVLCIMGKFEDLDRLMESSKDVPGFENMIPIFTGLAAAYSGKQEEALGIVSQLKEMFPPEAMPPPFFYLIAMIFMRLDMSDDSMDCLEKGLAFRATPFLFFHTDCTWDVLKEHPRFTDIGLRSGLPDMKIGTDHERTKYKKSQMERELADRIRFSLKAQMEQKQLFLDPKLNLADLAETCEVSVNQMSQFINSQLSKSFYDFVNKYRLDYFLEISRKREFENLSILGLAYESGFNSKTTFNTFFKKELHMTPKEYLKPESR